MGLFDIFRSGGKGDKKSNAASKWADVVGNRRAQGYERSEGIEALAALGTPEAAEALLKRFTFSSDPSITDQEEKEAAFAGIVRGGRDVIPTVREFAKKAESLAWPMRILKSLMKEEEFVDEILAWLARWDTEYAKFIDPKIQLLTALQDHENPKIREVVERFLEDVSDDARFGAALTLLKQRDPASLGPLMKAFATEESVRIKNKILDGLTTLGWKVPAESLQTVRRVAPYCYSIADDGTVSKLG